MRCELVSPRGGAAGISAGRICRGCPVRNAPLVANGARLSVKLRPRRGPTGVWPKLVGKRGAGKNKLPRLGPLSPVDKSQQAASFSANRLPVFVCAASSKCAGIVPRAGLLSLRRSVLISDAADQRSGQPGQDCGGRCGVLSPVSLRTWGTFAQISDAAESKPEVPELAAKPRPLSFLDASAVWLAVSRQTGNLPHAESPGDSRDRWSVAPLGIGGQTAGVARFGLTNSTKRLVNRFHQLL